MKLPVSETTFQSHDGLKIRSRKLGNLKGKSIILVNGLGGPFFVWQGIIEHLELEYGFYNWEYRGFFGSDKPKNIEGLSIQNHVKDLLTLIELNQIDKPILMGWSMGVQVALEFCRTHIGKIAGLILINGTFEYPFDTAFPFPYSRRLIYQLFDLFKAGHDLWHPLFTKIARTKQIPALAKKFGFVANSADNELIRQVIAEFVQIDFKVYFDQFKLLGNHSTRDILPHITVPTLIIAGERDPMTPARVATETHQLIPGAELFLVPLATHYAPIEFKEVINLRIENFLKSRFKG